MRFTTRRSLLRTLFIGGCAVPTVFSCVLAMFLHSPYQAHRRAALVERMLAGLLGVDVAVERVVRAPDGMWIVSGLQLLDRETGLPLLVARSVEAAVGATRFDALVHQARLERSGLRRLASLGHEQVLARGWHGQTLQVELPTLTIVDADEGAVESLQQVRCRVQETAVGTEALCQFRVAGSESDEPRRLRIVRNRQCHPPSTGWELHTGPTPLPCPVATPWLPALAELGPEASFTGSAWVELTPAGWNVEVQGGLQQVDLDRLVTGRFCHKLSGLADVHIERSTWHRGRLLDMTGRLRSAGGVISTSLLEAARDSLGLTLQGVPAGTMLARYQLLDVQFTLDTQRLVLAGHADPQQAVLVGEAELAVRVGDPQPVLPVALLRLLVPASEITVPATAETAWLVQMLPLPPVVPPATQSARVPYVPVRLRNR